MGVVEMHDAKKVRFLMWRAECAYLCTKHAPKTIFGYLVWVCQNMCIFGALITRTKSAIKGVFGCLAGVCV